MDNRHLMCYHINGKGIGNNVGYLNRMFIVWDDGTPLLTTSNWAMVDCWFSFMQSCPITFFPCTIHSIHLFCFISYKSGLPISIFIIGFLKQNKAELQRGQTADGGALVIKIKLFNLSRGTLINCISKEYGCRMKLTNQDRRSNLISKTDVKHHKTPGICSSAHFIWIYYYVFELFYLFPTYENTTRGLYLLGMHITHIDIYWSELDCTICYTVMLSQWSLLNWVDYY